MLYRPFQGGVSFVDHFCDLCFVFAMFSCLFNAVLWSPARKGLSPLVVFCQFPVWRPGSGVVLDYIHPDICLLTCFVNLLANRSTFEFSVQKQMNMPPPQSTYQHVTTRSKLASVLKTIFHQCVIIYN